MRSRAARRSVPTRYAVPRCTTRAQHISPRYPHSPAAHRSRAPAQCYPTAHLSGMSCAAPGMVCLA
ncbi:hypothetical protein HYPSUDRAFT_44396 [Hypholoma sublateritium FD-334 SS-4]|uniref:Uncharacterized protein n=1 Tax=Hypholoma sublateritium (strain FD-334 SS-4) TaxID=945553 RepID=A0A0D2NRM2_HYPSF|nr:hypothetical protein HYPSUDRAFT_44396 [Hypholoma sublateritium FD-334 SS-4]